MHAIKEVLDEAKYLIKDPVVLNKVLSKMAPVNAAKSRLVADDEALSQVDSLLIQTASENNFFLVSDDKKLLSIAKANKCRAVTTPRLIEWLAGKSIEKEEAVEMLDRLRETYIRKKAVDVVLRRLGKRR